MFLVECIAKLEKGRAAALLVAELLPPDEAGLDSVIADTVRRINQSFGQFMDELTSYKWFGLGNGQVGP
jgi:hypothetical protein